MKSTMEQIILMWLRKGNIKTMSSHVWIKHKKSTLCPFKSIFTFWLNFQWGEKGAQRLAGKTFVQLIKMRKLICLSVPAAFSFSLPLPFLKWSVGYSRRTITKPRPVHRYVSSIPTLTVIVQGLLGPHLEHCMNVWKGLVSISWQKSVYLFSTTFISLKYIWTCVSPPTCRRSFALLSVSNEALNHLNLTLYSPNFLPIFSHKGNLTTEAL